jgi:hypothetical protein
MPRKSSAGAAGGAAGGAALSDDVDSIGSMTGTTAHRRWVASRARAAANAVNQLEKRVSRVGGVGVALAWARAPPFRSASPAPRPPASHPAPRARAPQANLLIGFGASVPAYKDSSFMLMVVGPDKKLVVSRAGGDLATDLLAHAATFKPGDSAAAAAVGAAAVAVGYDVDDALRRLKHRVRAKMGASMHGLQHG